MKNKMFAIVISAVMIIVAVILVIMMVSGGQKETYFGYMKNSTTAEKVVSEKDHKVEENVKIPSKSGFNPKKGDFVKLIKSEGEDTYSKMEVVDHDDIPHGLMMKIHDMDMKGM
ncbi:DUF4889 domain-containing protein [Staphylococcus cohnii]|uniref:DUF4889 domain-containing protein n=1 Tax=Staphylococcus cohnii TaxID=29382 RepID=UPI00374F8A63